MKIITTRIQCRGCQTGKTIDCQSPSAFRSTFVPFKCDKCGSRQLAEIRRSFFRKTISIRIKMVAHTQTLLNILKKRRAHAPNHT